PQGRCCLARAHPVPPFRLCPLPRRHPPRRHRTDWWRSNNWFRGYSGLRVGFYYAPSYGYYQVPRQYWGRRWSEGDYLSSVFWRYQVNDYRFYGLGYPPAGT